MGIANLGNSLAALKKLVFEQGVVEQQELAAALEQDFTGLAGEQLRQRLTNAAPKYGNDLDEVDLLLVQAYQSYIDELKGLHNTRFGRGPIGGTYYAGTSSISANVPFGAATMATPDGRHARTPLAEGASPRRVRIVSARRRCSTPSASCPRRPSSAGCYSTRS